jgi:hypothetical protein
MLKGCPGAAGFKTPTWEEKICPVCGKEIEIFSVDMSRTCSCGFVAYNDQQSCIQWCKYAEECVGTELYESMLEAMRLKKEREQNEAKKGVD